MTALLACLISRGMAVRDGGVDAATVFHLLPSVVEDDEKGNSAYRLFAWPHA